MGRNRDNRPQRNLLSDQDRQAIIINGDAELLVQRAQEIGEALQRAKLNSTQIRNVFGTVRQIQMSWPLGNDRDAQSAAHRKLQLLKPKLAYQAARNDAVKSLAGVLTPAIDDVRADRVRFQNFVDFFEAILAYHRAAGGK